MTGKLVGMLAKRECFSLKKEESLLDASMTMKQHNIGAMPVINENNTLIGIISERDIARQISEENFTTDMKVENLMTKDVVTCDLNISVSELMETMTTSKIRHMIILDKQKLLGVVSIGDVVNHIIEQYKEENENLRNYINNF